MECDGSITVVQKRHFLADVRSGEVGCSPGVVVERGGVPVRPDHGRDIVTYRPLRVGAYP